MSWDREKSDTGTTLTSALDLTVPPKTYDEFIEMEGMDEWPQHLTSELPLSFEEEAAAFGTEKEITNLLKEAAPIDMAPLDEIQESLSKFEDQLMFYAKQFLTTAEEAEKHRQEQIQTMSTFDESKSSFEKSEKLQIRDKKDKKKKQKKGNTIYELKNKSVEFCSYPGFNPTELNDLPGSLEAPQILYRVTKALKISSGFRKFWRKIFISEASIALLQDAFWWLFLDRFEKEPDIVQKSKLFDRIADSFAALFFSIHPETKDKFFTIYPEALSQAVYSTYFEAFPESRKLIVNNDFKQYIVNIVEEWVHGGHPLPETFEKWNYAILEATLMPVQATSADVHEKSVAESVMQAAVAMNDPTEIKLNLETFEKSVKQLGTRTVNELSSQSAGTAKRKLPPIQPQTTSEKEESHPMGPGPSINRVPFDVYGSSPLMAHYLRLHRGLAPVSPYYSAAAVDEPLPDVVEHKKTLTRTEIRRPPQGRHTYKEFIGRSVQKSDQLRLEFDKIQSEAHQEIAEINQRKKMINYQIEKLEQELMKTRSTLELKLMSAKLMDALDLRLPTTEAKENNESSDDSD